MPTKVLVFESDSTFAEELRAGFARYACDTTVVEDASVGLQTAARVKPDLILLAIELPKMNGFSVCNKLKRDPGLKDVPLIILSSDSTDETFEQHRRLRTRAEDYVHKPVAFPDLMHRIQSFVPLASTNGESRDGDEILVEDDIEIEDATEVEIGDADLQLDSEVGADADHAFAAIVDPGGSQQGSVIPDSREPLDSHIEIADAEVLAEEPAEGPLDALSPSDLTEPSRTGLEQESVEIVAADVLPPSTGRAPLPSEPLEVSAGEILQDSQPLPVSPFRSDLPLDLHAADPFPREPPTRDTMASEPLEVSPGEIILENEAAPPVSSGQGLGPSSVTPPRFGASSRPVPSRPFPSRPPDAEVQRLREELERHRTRSAQLEEEARSAQRRIDELEEAVRRGSSKEYEVQRLQRELDEAKTKPPVAKGGGSARDFLDLREQLNRKDKEILDLRDQIMHREKELLAARDAALDFDRERADLSDRLGELERQAAELLRNNEALRNDKDAATKRADEFKRKAEKLKTDLDAKSVELEAKTNEAFDLKAQFDGELSKWTLREAELETKAQADLEQAVLATESTERERAEQALAKALEEAAAARDAALADLREHANTQRIEQLRQREAELTQEHEAHALALERGHQEALAQLRSEHEQRLHDTERAAAETLGARESELEAVRLRELEVSRKDYETRLTELEIAQAAALGERGQTIASLERDVSVRTAQRDDARREVERRDLRIEGLETDLLNTRERLDETRSVLDERERALTASRSELADQTALSSELQSRLEKTQERLTTVETALSQTSSELEHQSALLARDSELLARARGKWQEDRVSLERMKDALAAALAQIDEIEGRTFE